MAQRDEVGLQIIYRLGEETALDIRGAMSRVNDVGVQNLPH
jgi:hypothetical protein